MGDTTVKYFSSSMAGAPALSGTVGTLINVLDACLINGFGSVTLNSLSVVANMATATVNAGHNFPMTGATGPVIRIEGATPSALNNEWRIASVPNTTTFTFQTTGIADQAATGTITAKRAGAGWRLAFSDTNLAAYQSTSIGQQCLLRVNDSTLYSSACLGYEAMSDINTGTGPFPSSANYGMVRSLNNNSTANPWVVIADDQIFYMHVDFNNNLSYYSMQCFGNIISLNSTDAYHCVIARGVGGAGGSAPVQGGSNSSLFAINLSDIQMPRAYTQVGGAVSANLKASYLSTWGSSSIPYRDLFMNDLIASKISVLNGTTVVRGTLPGMYAPLNNFPSQAHHKTIITGNPGLPLRDILLLGGSGNRDCVAFDIAGPWR